MVRWSRRSGWNHSHSNKHFCNEYWLPALIILLWSTFYFPLPTADAAEWSFSPAVGAAGQYDSNILFTSSDEKSDFIAILEPKIFLNGRTEDSQLKFISRLRAEKYIENSDLDTIRNFTDLTVDHDWSPRLSTKLRAGYIRDTTLESQLEQAGIRTARVEYNRFNYGFTQDYDISETFSVSLNGDGSTVDYPANTFPDAQYWQAGFVPSWAISDVDRLGCDLSYGYTDYIDTSTIKNLRALLYWERTFSETAKFTLGAGYRHTWIDFFTLELTPSLNLRRVKESDTNSGWIFLALLNKNWTERLSTTFSAGRDEYNTYDARFFERFYLLSTLKYSISELVSADLEVRYFHNSQITRGDQTIDFIETVPSLVFQLTQNLSLGLRASYAYEISDVSSDNQTYNRFRSWLTINWNWPNFWTN